MPRWNAASPAFAAWAVQATRHAATSPASSGTKRLPAGRGPPAQMDDAMTRRRLIDLSHTIEAGGVTVHRCAWCGIDPLYGTLADFDVLVAKGNEIATVLSSIRGASEVSVEQITGQPVFSSNARMSL